LQIISRRTLKTMASATIRWWGEDLSVAVSLGCTSARTGDTVESLLQRAQPAVSDLQVAPSVRATAAEGNRSSQG